MSLFMPQSLDILLTERLTDEIVFKSGAEIESAFRFLQKKDWRFYAVSQSCGRAYYWHKVVTIPDWVFVSTQPRGRLQWYVSHEMAHGFDLEFKTFDRRAPHGDSFMKHLKDICPREFRYFEFGYKPQAAARNDILDCLNLDNI